MNGDSRETGKRTPTGEFDPSVFSTALNPAGIRLGTAVGLFVRRGIGGDAAPPPPTVRYREFWGTGKRGALVGTLANTRFEASYEPAAPTRRNRFSVRVHSVMAGYAAWPTIRELAEAEPFSGVQETRRGELMAMTRPDLESRISRCLDPTVSFKTLQSESIGPIDNAGRYDPERARRNILTRDPFNVERIVRCALLPLDNRYAYHTNVRPVWHEPRPEFLRQVRDNICLANVDLCIRSFGASDDARDRWTTPRTSRRGGAGGRIEVEWLTFPT